MPSGDIWMVIVLGSAAAGLWAVREFVRPANALGLSLFRPYRGESWPRGVQEEYDVRFDWSPRRPAPAPIQPTWSEVVVVPAATELDLAGFAGEVEMEDLRGETAAITQVHGDVHIAGH